MSQCSIAEQRGYLDACLGAEIQTALETSLPSDAPVYGQNSCMLWLEDKFQKKYPLFARRAAFMQYKPQPGSNCSSYVAQLKKLAGQASLHNITEDELIASRVVAELPNKELRQQLMQLPDPTLDRLIQKIDAFEGMQTGEQIVRDETATVARVQERRQKERGSRPQSQGQKSGRQNNAPASNAAKNSSQAQSQSQAQPRCNRCGSSFHKGSECQAEPRDCYNCGIRGHISLFCRKPKQNQGQGNSQKARQAQETHSSDDEASQPVEKASILRLTEDLVRKVMNTPEIAITV